MARKNVAEPSVSDGKNAAPEPTEAGTIQVQPVRRFMDGDIFRTPADDPFHVSRLRAAYSARKNLILLYKTFDTSRRNEKKDN